MRLHTENRPSYDNPIVPSSRVYDGNNGNKDDLADVSAGDDVAQERRKKKDRSWTTSKCRTSNAPFGNEFSVTENIESMADKARDT
ncbi:hypothetical protein HDU82_001564 [Entophlyctis luteolus]|nr:hypothetical protein HDU82_001564 [Entophlyctis luteolus]